MIIFDLKKSRMSSIKTSQNTAAPDICNLKNASFTSSSTHQKEEKSETYSDVVSEFGILRADDPLSQFVEQRVKELHPDLGEEEMPRVVVLGKKGMGINALAFDNGILALTPELIEFVMYKEELDAVIMHESRHICGQHIEKVSDMENLGQLVGQLRLHEYEADTSSFIALADPRCNSNPNGALIFLERIREYETQSHAGSKEDWDLIHGRMTDRIAVLRAVKQQFELGDSGNPCSDQLQSPLTYFPEELKNSCKDLESSDYQKLKRFTQLGVDPHDPDFREFIATVDKLSQQANTLPKTEKLLNYLKVIYGVGNSESAIRMSKLPSVRLLTQRIAPYTATVINGWIKKSKLLTDTFESPRQKQLALYAMIYNKFGIDLFRQSKDESIFITALRKAVLTGETKNLVLDNSDIKNMQEVFKILKFSNPVKSAAVLSQFTKALIEHGIFDSKEDHGLDASKISKWIRAAVKIVDISKTVPDKAVTAFVSEIIPFVFSTHLDLDGDQDAVNLISSIRTLSDKNSRVQAAIAETLLIRRFDDEHHKSIISKTIENDDIKERLALINKDVIKLSSMLTASPLTDETRHLTVKLLKNLYNLPHICATNNDEDIGIFTSKDLIVLGNTRPSRAVAVLNHLAGLDVPTENAGFLADTIIAAAQIASRNQSEYEEVLTEVAVFNDETPKSNKFWNRSLKLIVDKSTSNSILIPEEINKKLPTFKESKRFRTETATLAFAVLEVEILTSPDIVHYTRHITDYLETWRTPATDFDMLENLENVFNKGLSFFNAPPKSRDELKLLYDIAYFAPDVSLRRSIQSRLLPLLIDNLDTEKALSFVFDSYPYQINYGVSLQTLTSIDQSLRTPDDFRLAEERLSDFWNEASKSASAAGKLVLADTFSNILSNLDRSEFLEAILTTSQDDSALKKLLLQGWLLIDFRSIANFTDNVLLADDQTMRDKAYEQFRSSPRNIDSNNTQTSGIYGLTTPNMALQKLYALGPLERISLLRDALIGPGGILLQKDGRNKIVDLIFSKVIDKKDKDKQLRKKLEQVGKAFIHSASSDELAELLVATLAERVLQPPAKQTSWRPQVWQMLDENERTWKGAKLTGKIFTDNQSVKADYDDDSEDLDLLNSINDKILKNKILKELTPLFLPLIGEISSGAEDEMQRNLSRLNLLSSVSDSQDQRISALDFITQVGCRLDAPGVRTFQLLAQLWNDIPPEIQQSFMNMYDARAGQSALSAWQTLGKVVPSLRNTISELGPLLGGGSIYTVFSSLVGESAREAVRVMNPNALAHVQDRIKLLRKTLAALVKVDKSYAPAEPVLDLVEEWIVSEMQDKDFAKLDPVFRQNWHGWAPEWARKEGISILIPESKITETDDTEPLIKVVRDDLISDVTNFTSAEKLDPDLRKKMAALGAQFYVAQIIGKNPLGESIVLSDISKGNAGITSDGKQMAVFDRGMYLRINMMDKLQLKSILDAKTTEAKIDAVSKLLKSFSGNEDLNEKDLKKKINDFISQKAKSADPESVIFQVMSEMFCSGVKIPLKWNLLLKNINAWKQIVTEAGFSSLQEALGFKG